MRADSRPWRGRQAPWSVWAETHCWRPAWPPFPLCLRPFSLGCSHFCFLTLLTTVSSTRERFPGKEVPSSGHQNTLGCGAWLCLPLTPALPQRVRPLGSDNRTLQPQGHWMNSGLLHCPVCKLLKRIYSSPPPPSTPESERSLSNDYKSA